MRTLEANRADAEGIVVSPIGHEEQQPLLAQIRGLGQARGRLGCRCLTAGTARQGDQESDADPALHCLMDGMPYPHVQQAIPTLGGGALRPEDLLKFNL